MHFVYILFLIISSVLQCADQDRRSKSLASPSQQHNKRPWDSTTSLSPGVFRSSENLPLNPETSSDSNLLQLCTIKTGFGSTETKKDGDPAWGVVRSLSVPASSSVPKMEVKPGISTSVILRRASEGTKPAAVACSFSQFGKVNLQRRVNNDSALGNDLRATSKQTRDFCLDSSDDEGLQFELEL